MRALVVVVLLIAAAPALADIPAFFHELFLTHEAAYGERRAEELASWCAAHDLDPSHPENRATFLELAFLHDLFTGAGASTGDRGGILRIPYFWHWQQPNPRHQIQRHPDGKPLVDLAPPPEYGKYQSVADIDRVPVLYLTDLVTAEPRYQHPRFGTFHTFGWCSEREMAFVALTTALGYQAKIKQGGIHTWSEIWCPLRLANGGTAVLIATVDNTFDSLDWRLAPPFQRLEDWARDIGAGDTIAWYDRKAHAPAQLAALAAAPVSEAGAARIDTLVRASLTARR